MSQLELPMPVTGLPLDLRALSAEIHSDNIRMGWWKQDNDRTTLPRNTGELIALIHSEISEADEGFTLELMDDKLPHRQMFEVELADTAIRVLDMLGFYNHPCVGARTLPLPDTDRWSRWYALLHGTTTKAMERFRKGDAEGGCAYLVDLLGFIHYCALSYGLDLSGAIAEKRAFNAIRADHKVEARSQAGGKAF